jgi:hypothetical protein
VIGVCRFSYPATGGFRLSSKDTDKVIDALYEPSADARRFALFREALPPVAGRADGSGFHGSSF